jgi:hypothetical protein
MHVKYGAAVALAALLTIGCGGVTDPSKNVQDTFTGTLAPNTAIPFKINVSNGGEFSVKITQLAPNATAIIGTEWDFGDNCDLLVQRNQFTTLNTPALAGAVLQKGTYCAVVYDSIGLTQSQTFTMVVSHP